MRTQNPGSTPFDESSLTADLDKKLAEKDEGASDESTFQSPSPLVTEVRGEQLSIRKRLLNWRTLVPLVIVLGLLIYTSQKLQINPAETWEAVRSANILFFLAAFLVYYLSFPLRTFRWRLLLENVGYQQENGVHLPRFWKLLEIVYTSWFANAIVPAKLGDLYRAYLLRQEAGVSVTRTIGTVLAERLLDLTVLLVLFMSAILISLRQNLPSFLQVGLYITLGLVLGGLSVLVLLRSFRHQLRRFIPKRFQIYYDQLHEGTLGSFQRIPLLAGLTTLVWICEAGRFFFIALSLNLIDGSLLHIGAAAVFIALGEALLSTVPFTSGGIGLVEGGMMGMLILFTTARNQAAAGILLDRTISLLSLLLIGFIVFLISSGRRAAKKPRKP